jgi:hypothetical protein
VSLSKCSTTEEGRKREGNGYLYVYIPVTKRDCEETKEHERE